jgi:putative aminopeptidase FrvX
MNEEFLKKLIFAFGPSSKEEAVKKVIKQEIGKNTGEINEDKFGNLVVHVEGDGPKLMIAAHMDQIGVMVTDIDKNGFLRLGEVGGIRKSFLVGQKLIFENGVEGFVYYEDKKSPWEAKDVKMENLFVDIGVKDKGAARKSIGIGTQGVYKPTFYTSGSRVIAPALDDRIGCYILAELINSINNKKLSYDFYGVFTVQEEIGVKGAKVSSYEIAPDIGIAVDVTNAGDMPDTSPVALSLGKGPAVKIMDRGMISSKMVRDKIIETAEKSQIPYQREIITAGTTDAYAMQITKSGVETGALSISTRYIHTPGETLDLNDVTNAIKLLKKFVENRR